MNFRALLTLSGLVAFCLTSTGCGEGGKYVPVSGVVTLDGKPYPNATVSFQPEAKDGIDAGGVGSAGVTDAEGKFTLMSQTAEGYSGAIVGRHRVQIVTNDPDIMKGYNAETGSPDGVVTEPTRVKTDPIPAEWNSQTTKTFDVPAGGTDKANFDIKSK